MKILFICHANVGRSQVAMELYRARGGRANSAGTYVNKPGTTLHARPSSLTIRHIMLDKFDINMASNKRTQLTKKLAEPYDKLVVITNPKTWPRWLTKDQRVEYWKIPDSKGQSSEVTATIVQDIHKLVNKLPL